MILDTLNITIFNNLSQLQVDNSRTVLLKIATLYAERLMNDICLVVDGVEYPAHRLILCASSDVFQVSVKTYNIVGNDANLLQSDLLSVD